MSINTNTFAKQYRVCGYTGLSVFASINTNTLSTLSVFAYVLCVVYMDYLAEYDHSTNDVIQATTSQSEAAF